MRVVAARFPGSLEVEPSWLDMVKACNDIAPGSFDEPRSTVPWWAGGTVEEYADGRIIRRDDSSVSITSTTDAGAVILAEAAARLGVHTVQTEA